jgi:hypothetical protein
MIAERTPDETRQRPLNASREQRLAELRAEMSATCDRNGVIRCNVLMVLGAIQWD